MPRIKCGSIDCKWNSDTNMCKYGRTGHTLLISDTYTHTVNDGVQHFHRCKGYEKSEEAARLESEFAELLKGEISKCKRHFKEGKNCGME